MASVAKPKEIKEILELALKNEFVKARSMLLDTMLRYGLSGVDIIKQIQKELMELDIDSRKKMGLIADCGETEFRLSEGSDEFIQLEALLSKVTLAGSK
jgi:replication factor C small subunit